eukprot:CAMPEP_0117527294 /NCGR_PEP_ID=MMETSP0784-20121206/36721_1 /TAXON_ID=39447 /ORGANISM="" /LENGTH=240 /DNA_ID=CAMNT_0005323537 /DNA_START=98 /DNA_END=820 /DNA_ORIENTATION=+
MQREAPLEGLVLELQSASGCCPPPPAFKYNQPEALPISNSDWRKFEGQVQGACAAMKREELCFLLLLVAIPGFLLQHVLDMDDGGILGQLGGAPFIAVGFIGFLMLRLWIVTQNEQQDKVIERACNELASATNGQVSVQYRTKYTGFCRPKHAKPYRAIAFCSVVNAAAGTVVAQMMNCQIPEGTLPGSMLQVQGPQGQTVQVVVPPDMTPGQTMQVQVPTPMPPAVIQATVVSDNYQGS